MIHWATVPLLSKKAENVLFIDDKKENVIGARKVGMYAIHFKNPTQLVRELKEKYDLDISTAPATPVTKQASRTTAPAKRAQPSKKDRRRSRKKKAGKVFKRLFCPLG